MEKQIEKEDKTCKYNNCKKDGVYLLEHEGVQYWMCTKKHVNAFLDDFYGAEDNK